MDFLASQYSLKTDQFPKTLKAAQGVLDSHKWEKAYHKAKKNKKE